MRRRISNRTRAIAAVSVGRWSAAAALASGAASRALFTPCRATPSSIDRCRPMSWSMRSSSADSEP
jgi:hypothetical protein